MAAPNKPGLDWTAIRAEYERGITAAELSRRHPVTKQSIGERAKREGWSTSRRDLKRQALNTLPVSIRQGRLSTTRTPETIAELLDSLAQGVGRPEAAALAGIAESTLYRWLQSDSELVELVAQAERIASAGDLKAITAARDRGDWKAAAWRLERKHRTEYGAGHSQPVGFRVVLNVGRDAPPPPVVDVQPEE